MLRGMSDASTIESRKHHGVVTESPAYVLGI